jgi:hypothetical protein
MLAAIRLEVTQGTRELKAMDPESTKEFFNLVVSALASGSDAYYQTPDFANATAPLERASRLKTPSL